MVPPARRLHIARNMLLYGKDLAEAKGMQRLMALVEATNHAVIHLNYTMGLEVGNKLIRLQAFFFAVFFTQRTLFHMVLFIYFL